jgi:glycosyltransferase involved in cell wall biosynthesis
MNNQTTLNRLNKTSITPASNIMPPLPLPFTKVIGRKRAPQSIKKPLPEVLFITSYPPRECGIATYAQDLLKALNNKFTDSFSLKVCALESDNTQRNYPKEVDFVLNTHQKSNYLALLNTINNHQNTKLIFIQHEFGLFEQSNAVDFLQFIYSINKPIVLVFHTVLPRPNAVLQTKVKRIVAACASVIVMTHNAADILKRDYGVAEAKISIIPHGTHLVEHLDKTALKEKYGLVGKKIVSTFGLINSGKSIETTLDALPNIIKCHPDIMFLVIGKTHSGILQSEGESYRKLLEAKVDALNLHNHVQFINQFLPLPDLLEYLQLTDIYLFTSKDPNQAVSGTFSYAMSCGCPIISTPIPHAKEVLTDNTGIIVDFEQPQQLANAVNLLFHDDALRQSMSLNILQHMAATAWENSAIAHALLLQKAIEAHEPIIKVENQQTHPPSVLRLK